MISVACPVEEDDISSFRQASSSASDVPELASPRGRNELRRKVSDDGEGRFYLSIASLDAAIESRRLQKSLFSTP